MINSLASAAALGMLPPDVRCQIQQIAKDEVRIFDICKLTGTTRKMVQDYLATKPYSLWDLWWGALYGGEAYQDLKQIATDSIQPD